MLCVQEGYVAEVLRVSMIRDELSEFAYMASCASLGYHVSVTPRGIGIPLLCMKSSSQQCSSTAACCLLSPVECLGTAQLFD